VQQQVHAAGVREGRRAVGPREGLAKGTYCVKAVSDQIFEKFCGPRITLFSGVFYLILTENDALLCHFALHRGVRESNPTVKPGLVEMPTTQ